MKFALAGLVALTQAQGTCWAGCPCVNYGDWPKMEEQAHCIYDHFRGDHKEIDNRASVEKNIESFCNWRTGDQMEDQCHMIAEKYTPMLV